MLYDINVGLDPHHTFEQLKAADPQAKYQLNNAQATAILKVVSVLDQKAASTVLDEKTFEESKGALPKELFAIADELGTGQNWLHKSKTPTLLMQGKDTSWTFDLPINKIDCSISPAFVQEKFGEGNYVQVFVPTGDVGGFVPEHIYYKRPWGKLVFYFVHPGPSLNRVTFQAGDKSDEAASTVPNRKVNDPEVIVQNTTFAIRLVILIAMISCLFFLVRNSIKSNTMKRLLALDIPMLMIFVVLNPSVLNPIVKAKTLGEYQLESDQLVLIHALIFASVAGMLLVMLRSKSSFRWTLCAALCLEAYLALPDLTASLYSYLVEVRFFG